MSVTNQVILFLEFTCVGMILAIIFDFFRAYRKIKIPTTTATIFQDILYFVIATLVVVISTISFLDSNFRLYIIVSVLLGVAIHVRFFSKYTLKLFMLFFKTSKSLFEFLNITLAFYIQIFTKILTLLKKIVKKCCKTFFYVIDCNRYKDKILHKNVKNKKNNKVKKEKKKKVKLFKQKRKNLKEV